MYKSIVILTCVALSCLAGCKKELTEKPYSFLSESSVFSSENGLKQAVLGVYESQSNGDWPSRLFTWILSEVGHRYTTFGQTGAHFTDAYQKFNVDPTSGDHAGQWREFYKVISKANIVIANATKAVPDQAVADKYIAEARFLRAYAYFILVRWFGDIPIVDQAINSISQTDLILGERKPVEEVYNLIISDLEFAEANLVDKWDPANRGRVNKGVAKAMLGKVYLTMAGKPLSKTECFQKAADKLSEVVGANEAVYDFALLDNFSDVFSLANERNPELLLSFSHYISSTNSNGSIYPFFLGPNGMSGESQDCVGYTYELYQLYEDNDTRRDFTLPTRYVDTRNGDSIVFDPQYPGYWNKTKDNSYSIQRSGIGWGKYGREGWPSVPWGYSCDQVHMRFSDVLLMLAEALNETNHPEQALVHLNRVRERADASTLNILSVPDLRQAIRKERLLELVGEFTTVFDIRRWGTLQEEMNAMSADQVLNRDLSAYDSKYELYPIPQREIDANPALTQNPGY